MDHEEAVRTHATERYAMEELTDSERDEFEEHFFQCSECAEDVRSGAMLAANARAVFLEQSRKTAAQTESKLGWLAWLHPRPAFTLAATAACAVLAIISGYQTLVVVPGLRTELKRATAPQAYPAVFLRPVVRGDDQIIELARDSRYVGLSLDLPPDRQFRSYHCEFLAEAGVLQFALAAPAPRAAGVALDLLVPADHLPPGRYTLFVRGMADSTTGTPGPEVARYKFVIRRP